MSTFILVIIVYNDSKQHDDSIQRYSIIFPKGIVLGSTVVSPYVGMARKQNGGYNAVLACKHAIISAKRRLELLCVSLETTKASSRKSSSSRPQESCFEVEIGFSYWCRRSLRLIFGV